MWSASSTARSSDVPPATYDRHFEAASARYLPAWDARWLKAQCWVESHFDARAVSPVGARGLCQFMPATWAWTTARLGLEDASPYHAPSSILAAAYYMGWLRERWSAPRPEPERRELALASYVAGFGSILSAQGLCADAPRWAEIRVCLAWATSPDSARQAIDYVDKVHRYAGLLGARE